MMFSLEDMDETVVDTNAKTAVDPEIIEDANELESDSEAFDESVDNLVTLEALAIAAEESLEDGGLDPAAANIMEISTEHLCARLGMSNTKLMVANEQFGSSNTRLAATKISLEEGMWNTIKEGWNKMIAWIKEQCKKIADFFRKLVNGFSYQEMQIKKFDEKVALIKDGAKFTKSFKDETLCEKFRHASGGSSATGKDCIQTLSNTVQVVNKVSSTVKSFKVDKGSATIFKVDTDKSVLLNGHKYVVSESGMMQLLSPPAGGGSSYQCDTMDKTQMGSVLTSCKALLKEVQEMVTKDVDIKRFENEIIKEITKAQKAAESAEAKQMQAENKKIISANAKAIFSVSNVIPKLAITTVSSALGYVSKSLSQYEKE